MDQTSTVEQIQIIIGERIKAARLEAEMTQEEAAQAAQIDYKRWQRLEAGEVNATLKTLVRASETVHINVGNLFDNK